MSENKSNNDEKYSQWAKEFHDWANHPVTCRVRNHLISELRETDTVSGSGILKNNAYGQGLNPLEALGVESAMRLSVVKGIEAFTDFDSLPESVFSYENQGADND